MANLITVKFVNGQARQYCAGVSIKEISEDVKMLYPTPIVAAKVDNEIKDLQTTVDRDYTVDFLDLETETGIKVYLRSLTLVFITAVSELYPHGEATVEHSLSKGLYCELHIGRELTKSDIQTLQARMQQIVEQNRPIVRKVIPTVEAIELFNQAGQLEKVKLLKQLRREKVSLYFCGQTYEYLYGTMTPSTGYLKIFDLKLYAPGMILCFPEKEKPDELPEFVQQPKLATIFREAEQWGEILGCGYVATLNEYIERNKINDIIRVAEALHEKKIAQIADFVAEHRREVRIILVAGPSSSGKTTFAQRLNIQLRVNGLRPVPISLDDYFIDREHTPRDEKGNYDFESIEAIDLVLFNQHLTRLLDGDEVQIPSYNFKTGQREFLGHVIQLYRDQPLIVEGIHGLNERLTAAIDRENKIKIYISALTQLSIDNHNRIPTTDARLIRRLVRDSQFRGHDAIKTLQFWPSVRKGEEKNIFPFQEEADIMFNSALIYELSVLKKYAEPLLQKVTCEQPEYSEARRLLNFLEYFYSVPDDEIPFNSILREFIGKSCFFQ